MVYTPSAIISHRSIPSGFARSPEHLQPEPRAECDPAHSLQTLKTRSSNHRHHIKNFSWITYFRLRRDHTVWKGYATGDVQTSVIWHCVFQKNHYKKGGERNLQLLQNIFAFVLFFIYQTLKSLMFRGAGTPQLAAWHVMTFSGLFQSVLSYLTSITKLLILDCVFWHSWQDLMNSEKISF